MQAIRTKYFGCTDSKGSRIQAKAEARTIYVGYDHALNLDGNHAAACEALRVKLGWDGPMVGGSFGDAMYWVFV